MITYLTVFLRYLIVAGLTVAGVKLAEAGVLPNETIGILLAEPFIDAAVGLLSAAIVYLWFFFASESGKAIAAWNAAKAAMNDTLTGEV